MIPEIGAFLLCLALVVALLLAFFPLWGTLRQELRFIALARPLACALFVCVTGAFLILIHVFVVNDFSVTYVAANSNSLLPLRYRIAATWGAHEGSLLLWVWLLASWTLAVALFSRRIPTALAARVLAVMGAVNVGFLLFVLLASNPFLRTLPDLPIDGSDLNPMLQDIGLVIHPPLLYMGYVGFSVTFAFAIAALLAGELDKAWVRWLRPWATAAWVCLTLGIVLGSAWAYYELGWGGWWFWDPVENASLMPWLSGTALLHSLSVTEKRGGFKAWTLLLAIATFALSLLGTFLVRSGIVISVHAFASDPTRGMLILIFLVVIIGGSLLLYALRGSRLPAGGYSALWSKETFLSGNNMLLLAAMLVVLLGTLLPLLHKLLGLGTISIGEPFFNSLFALLMMPLALMMGLAPSVSWGRDRPRGLWKRSCIAAVIALALSLWVPLGMAGGSQPRVVIGMLMVAWILFLTLTTLFGQSTPDRRLHFSPNVRSCSYWGMVLGHAGVAITVAGITLSQNYSVGRDVRMQVGDAVSVGEYHFTLRTLRDLTGPNYSGTVGIIDVFRDDRRETTLYAEKRDYAVTRMTLTEAAIDGGWTRDLYAALGEPLGSDTWAVRIYVKPFVRWIWAGGLLMAAGGMVCLLDPRYRRRRKTTKRPR